MTDIPRRGFNSLVTGFWSVAASGYDLAPLQRWVYRPAQDEMVTLLRVHRSRRIADIACGTGILAARIHDELDVDEVFGVDMSTGMLAQAKARSPEVGWLTGPAEQLPFDDAALDAVVTTSAFHFFDQPAALREFRRVLAPGGLVAVATISPPCPPPLDRLSRNIRNPAHNPSASELHTLFDDAGFIVTEQHRVRRPLWTRAVSDLITVGVRA
ncbi:MAG: class I SAM-dependent methyltransferase [Mycobacterium sp.]